MPRYRLSIEYDGTDWHGWQIQDGQRTIQGELENALAVILRTPVGVTGSGRTDAGVHARCQVAHLTLDDRIETRRLLGSLNGVLPRSIAVTAVEETHDAFHARFDAISRRYVYRISTGSRALERSTRLFVAPPPDFERMNEAARLLLGTHDFTSFCRTSSETTNRVCTLSAASWIAEERAGDWEFVVEADRFLHGMVRTIVGTLLDIGHARLAVAELPAIVERRDRRAAGAAAPARGLILDHVRYA